MNNSAPRCNFVGVAIMIDQIQQCIRNRINHSLMRKQTNRLFSASLVQTANNLPSFTCMKHSINTACCLSSLICLMRPGRSLLPKELLLDLLRNPCKCRHGAKRWASESVRAPGTILQTETLLHSIVSIFLASTSSQILYMLHEQTSTTDSCSPNTRHQRASGLAARLTPG